MELWTNKSGFAKGRILQVYPLPGVKQEGITVDEDGFMYIAQDSETSLLKSSQK